MKFAISLMLLGLIVLSCRKETKVNTTTSDSVITDTIPSDTVVTAPTPMPSDTLGRADSASTNRMDTVKTKGK